MSSWGWKLPGLRGVLRSLLGTRSLRDGHGTEDDQVDLITYAKSGLLAADILRFLLAGFTRPTLALAWWSSLFGLALLFTAVLMYESAAFGRITPWAVVLGLATLTAALALAARAARSTSDAGSILMGGHRRRRALQASALLVVVLFVSGRVIDPQILVERGWITEAQITRALAAERAHSSSGGQEVDVAS